MSRYTALLDACVLVPIVLTDTLLRIAERDLYRPLWSDRILEEALEATIDTHSDIDPERLRKRFETMSTTFEDACVVDWEHLEATIELPDPEDRHVVAAAIRGRADCIVTANLRDFPTSVLDELDIEVTHPDDFLVNQFDLAPRIVLDVIRDQSGHAVNPMLTPMDLVARLSRAGVPNFADLVARTI